jgi:hypothetical protein
MTSTTTGPLHGLDDIRALCAALLPGDDAAEAAIAVRQAQLTKPAGSLGRLEALAGWLGRWQGREMPRLGRWPCCLRRQSRRGGARRLALSRRR